jgi:cytochrome c peroxidase
MLIHLKKKKAILLSLACMYIFLSFSYYRIQADIPTPYTLQYDTAYLPEPKIPLDNPLTVEGIALGRLLFYDSLLSVNKTQSCASCHKQEHFFTDTGKSVSNGALKIPGDFNTMPLANLAWQAEFFWDGRAKSLEEQVLEPIQKHNEMAKDLAVLVRELNTHKYYPVHFKKAFPDDKKPISANNISKALAQFIRTIYVSPKPFENGGFGNQEGDKLPDSVRTTKKFTAFAALAAMCSDCHSSEFYGGKNGQLASNGINYYDKDSTNNNQKFKAPSLINLAYTAPYMHDGRFKTLYEVIDHYDQHITELDTYNPDIVQNKIKNKFSKAEKTEMVNFLLSLKDTTILTNKKYSNPFASQNFKWQDYPYFK